MKTSTEHLKAYLDRRAKNKLIIFLDELGIGQYQEGETIDPDEYAKNFYESFKNKGLTKTRVE